MKKIFKLALVFVLVFLFGGCAKIEQFFVMAPTGEIIMGCNIEIDRDTVNQAYNETIGTNHESPSSSELIEFVVKLMLNEKTAYEIAFETTESKKPNYTIDITIDNKDYQTANLAMASTAQFKLTFKTYLDYEKGNALLSAGNEHESTRPVWTTSFFTYKMKITNPSSFEGILNDANNGLVSHLQEYFQTFDIKNDVKFLQTYATLDSKLRSNATHVSRKNGVSYHSWEMNSEQASSQDAIEMYFLYPNSSGWYTVTISLTALFLFCIVMFNIYKTSLAKKNARNLADKNIENKDYDDYY